MRCQCTILAAVLTHRRLAIGLAAVPGVKRGMPSLFVTKRYVLNRFATDPRTRTVDTRPPVGRRPVVVRLPVVRTRVVHLHVVLLSTASRLLDVSVAVPVRPLRYSMPIRPFQQQWNQREPLSVSQQTT